MGLLDAFLGRRKPAQPSLDAFFALPSAAITVQAALDFVPTGRAGIAFRAPEGRAFHDVQSEIERLLTLDASTRVEIVEDSYGFDWVTVETDPADVSAATVHVHAANVSLVESGFGSHMLCAMWGFRGPEGSALALVYLYKSGTFYPFAPRDGTDQVRDNVLEIQIRDLIAGEVPIERDTRRWLAVWDAPVLRET